MLLTFIRLSQLFEMFCVDTQWKPTWLSDILVLQLRRTENSHSCNNPMKNNKHRDIMCVGLIAQASSGPVNTPDRPWNLPVEQLTHIILHNVCSCAVCDCRVLFACSCFLRPFYSIYKYCLSAKLHEQKLRQISNNNGALLCIYDCRFFLFQPGRRCGRSFRSR